MGAKQRVEAFIARQTEEYQSLNEKIVSKRILSLFDEDSFIELAKDFGAGDISQFRESQPKEGVSTGLATLHDYSVVVIAQDPEIHKGSLGVYDMLKINNALEKAIVNDFPVVLLLDSAGIQIDQGAEALLSLSEMLDLFATARRVVPTVAMIFGSVVGSLSLIPRMAAFTIMNRQFGAITVNGPMVVAATEGQTPDHLLLGGGEVQAACGGVDFLVEDESAMGAVLADILDKLGHQASGDDPNRVESELDEIAKNSDVIIDMDRIFKLVTDRETFRELNAEYAKDLVTGWGQLDGETVALMGSNSDVWTAHMCWKAINFIEKMDELNIRLINFVRGTNADISSCAEKSGLNLALAKLRDALNESTSLTANVMVGKVHGVMYQTLVTRTDEIPSFLWPSAELSLVSADTGATILYADELEGVENPVAKRKELADRFVDEFASTHLFERLHLNFQTIAPRGTRQYLLSYFNLTERKEEF